MAALCSGPTAGTKLRERRLSLDISIREVENNSRIVAEVANNKRYYVSHSTLVGIEKSRNIPNIYSLYAIAVIYRLPVARVLSMYGIDLDNISSLQSSIPLRNTNMASDIVCDGERQVSVPLKPAAGMSLKDNNLVSEMIAEWGELPLAMLENLSNQCCGHGYVGSKDYTMYPLLRPGSFLQIDSHDKRPQERKWSNEYDRPIYFIELRDGYAVGWCDLEKDRLSLVPHPLSRLPVRHFRYPSEAEIVGRVTAVSMSLRTRRGAAPEFRPSGINGHARSRPSEQVAAGQQTVL